MQSEIQDELLRIKIAEREVRKSKGLKTAIIILLATFFIVVPYYNPLLVAFYGIAALIITLGGLYILLSATPINLSTFNK